MKNREQREAEITRKTKPAERKNKRRRGGKQDTEERAPDQTVHQCSRLRLQVCKFFISFLSFAL
jgi:hypothetical protein